MKTSLAMAVAGALLVASFGASTGSAQDVGPPAQAPQETVPALSPAELDQMLAPIALYPDALLAQILMAATYPLEVVEASRWLQDPANAALKGDQLTAALDAQDWDESVKSLVPFPQVLRMMDGKLEWTERLGDAFLADQSAVMDAVQRLRQRASAAGKLRTTPQQIVGTSDDLITIAAPSPEIVYVPVYDPGVVYGPWPYPAYPPYYFPGYFDMVVFGGFGFGWFGAPILYPYWGWGYCDWRRHRIHIDHDRHHYHGRPGGNGDWRHDPGHRHGVPYRDPTTQNRFGGRGVRDGHGYSGPAGQPRPRPGDRQTGVPKPADNNPGVRPGRGQTSGARPPATQQDRAVRPGGGRPQPQPQPQPQRVIRPAPAQHVPPAAESYGRGADVRAQADRGRESRTWQAGPPQRSSPPPRWSPPPRSAPPRSMPSQPRGAGQQGGRRH